MRADVGIKPLGGKIEPEGDWHSPVKTMYLVCEDGGPWATRGPGGWGGLAFWRPSGMVISELGISMPGTKGALCTDSKLPMCANWGLCWDLAQLGLGVLGGSFSI